MRTMLKVHMDVQAGNRAIKDGTLGRLVEATMAELKPEAAYFYAEGGKRTQLLVFDLKDPADIPRIVEPYFMQLDADVEICPVMNAEQLKQGLSKLR